MKFHRLLLGLSIAIIIHVVHPDSARSQTLLDGYSFNDGTAVDSAGSTNGTLSKTGATISGGGLNITNNAFNTGVSLYTFGGIGDYAPFTDGSFTVEDWFTPEVVTPDYSTLFSFSNARGTDLLCHLDKPDAGAQRIGALTMEYQMQFTSYFRITLTAPPPAAGVETCIATTYDANSDIVSLYINGTLAMNNLIPGGFHLNALLYPQPYGAVGIGGYDQYDDPATQGTHDEFRFYTGVLTASQIAGEAAAGPNIVSVPETAIAPWLVALATTIMRTRRRFGGPRCEFIRSTV